MRGVAVGAQGALDIHEQGLLSYGGLGCGRGPDQAIQTYRGPRVLGRKPETGPEQTRDQGLLNYGGPKLWKRSGSGDPNLQGA